MKKYLSAGEAIKICEMNRRTFYKAERKGLINPSVLVGKFWKGYLKEDAENLKNTYKKIKRIKEK